MGRDFARFTASPRLSRFQSTLPAWGETITPPLHLLLEHISIHSPRMGRDYTDSNFAASAKHFNPLSPHGERPALFFVAINQEISIHSPRMGRDNGLDPTGIIELNFNPLSPHGERRQKYRGLDRSEDFNPLSPHGERPLAVSRWEHGQRISIHSPRMGRDYVKN